MNYACSILLPVSNQFAFSFFSDLERWFRLNPQWDVESFGEYEISPGKEFPVTVKYDRSEIRVPYLARITEWVEGEHLSLMLHATDSRKFSITVIPEGSKTRLLYSEQSDSEPTDADKVELNLWLRSAGNYIEVTSRRTLRSRLWKWFVDRIWLKMSLFGRRISLFVLLGEAFSLVLFILFLVWHYYLR